MFVCQYVMHAYMTCLLRKLLMHSIFSCLHKSSPVIPELSTITRPAVCSDYCSTERGGVNWSDQKRGLEERNRKKSNDHMTEWGIIKQGAKVWGLERMWKNDVITGVSETAWGQRRDAIEKPKYQRGENLMLLRLMGKCDRVLTSSKLCFTFSLCWIKLIKQDTNHWWIGVTEDCVCLYSHSGDQNQTTFQDLCLDLFEDI